jgi:hypothetical protein
MDREGTVCFCSFVRYAVALCQRLPPLPAKNTMAVAAVAPGVLSLSTMHKRRVKIGAVFVMARKYFLEGLNIVHPP